MRFTWENVDAVDAQRHALFFRRRHVNGPYEHAYRRFFLADNVVHNFGVEHIVDVVAQRGYGRKRCAVQNYQLRAVMPEHVAAAALKFPERKRERFGNGVKFVGVRQLVRKQNFVVGEEHGHRRAVDHPLALDVVRVVEAPPAVPCENAADERYQHQYGQRAGDDEAGGAERIGWSQA